MSNAHYKCPVIIIIIQYVHQKHLPILGEATLAKYSNKGQAISNAFCMYSLFIQKLFVLTIIVLKFVNMNKYKLHIEYVAYLKY